MPDVLTDPSGGLVRRLRDVGGGAHAPEVVVVPTPPTAANLLSGRAAASGAVFLTVPAGRTWRGHVHVSAAASAAIGAAAAVETCSVAVIGAGAVPAAGTLLQLALALAATTATGTQGATASDRATIPLTLTAGAAAPAELQLVLSAGLTAGRATAVGELVA